MYLAVVGSCKNVDGPWSFVNLISRANCNLSSKISPFRGVATLFRGVATLFLRSHYSLLRRALRTHLLMAGERLPSCYCDQATVCQTRNCGSNPDRGDVFFFSPNRQGRLWGSPSLLYNRYQGFLPKG